MLTARDFFCQIEVGQIDRMTLETMWRLQGEFCSELEMRQMSDEALAAGILTETEDDEELDRLFEEACERNDQADLDRDDCTGRVYN